jgi:hypothetical protein
LKKRRVRTQDIEVRAGQEKWDLYYSMATFSLWGEVDYEIDCNKVKVSTKYYFWDYYYWHSDGDIAAGGSQKAILKLKDKFAQPLVNSGMAKNFKINGYWVGMEKVYTFPTYWLNLPAPIPINVN